MPTSHAIMRMCRKINTAIITTPSLFILYSIYAGQLMHMRKTSNKNDTQGMCSIELYTVGSGSSFVGQCANIVVRSLASHIVLCNQLQEIWSMWLFNSLILDSNILQHIEADLQSRLDRSDPQGSWYIHQLPHHYRCLDNSINS